MQGCGRAFVGAAAGAAARGPLLLLLLHVALCCCFCCCRRCWFTARHWPAALPPARPPAEVGPLGLGGEPPGSSGAVELPEPEMSNLKDIAKVGGIDFKWTAA